MESKGWYAGFFNKIFGTAGASEENMVNASPIDATDELAAVSGSSALELDEVDSKLAEADDSAPDSYSNGDVETSPAVVGKMNILKVRDRAIIEDGELSLDN